MKRIVIAGLKRLQAKFESLTAKAMGHPSKPARRCRSARTAWSGCRMNADRPSERPTRIGRAGQVL